MNIFLENLLRFYFYKSVIVKGYYLFVVLLKSQIGNAIAS